MNFDELPSSVISQKLQSTSRTRVCYSTLQLEYLITDVYKMRAEKDRLRIFNWQKGSVPMVIARYWKTLAVARNVCRFSGHLLMN